jgi:hypothetical protein
MIRAVTIGPLAVTSGASAAPYPTAMEVDDAMILKPAVADT